MVACAASQAAVTITIEESGGDVVATASGSLDTSSTTSSSAATVIPLFEYVAADNYAYIVGVGGVSSATAYGAIFGTAQPLNSSSISEEPDSSTGAPVGVDALGGGAVILYAPAGYISGGSINATSTWAGQTLAGLGLTPGSYVFDFGSDRVTYTVVDPSVTPPQPGQAQSVPGSTLFTLVLSALGLTAMAWRSLRRRRT